MHMFNEEDLRKDFEEWFETHYLPDGESCSFEREQEFDNWYMDKEVQAAWSGYCVGVLDMFNKMLQKEINKAHH